MKTKSMSVPCRAESSNLFTWAKVHAQALKFRAMLPAEFREILPIESVKSLKITLSLLAVTIAVFLGPVVSLPVIALVAYGNRQLILSEPAKGKKGGKV